MGFQNQDFTAVLDAKCRETIETSYPLFVIHHNHVTTIPDETIFHLCRCIFASALQKLPVQNQDAIDFLCLRKMLSSIFDADHRAFVLDEPDQRILATMDADAKACIFAQAIAGLVYLLRKVATCSHTLSPEVFDAKLQRFAASEERKVMLDAIEKSPVWSNCFEKAHIGNMIMDAVSGKPVAGAEVVAAPENKKRGTEVSVVEVSEQDLVTKQLWDDGPHMQRDFGVPDVFQIMVLN
ncbi:hypothetical protein J7T55_003847 [Diaporthe amygdali]|uniref:uncharacterized protein n=1 Tax=Phomopsis amygdali TaxID=1214568 RepID=UPI0022FE5605|nr:uncharacterized protein J7T55_003847 [Diaporthe amygdali]KAJ0117433.1 hypothetical protein J7T55_003847 [Diaporthe amygdali]